MDVEAVVAVMMKMLAMDAAAKAVMNTAMTETMDAEAMAVTAMKTVVMDAAAMEMRWRGSCSLLQKVGNDNQPKVDRFEPVRCRGKRGS